MVPNPKTGAEPYTPNPVLNLNHQLETQCQSLNQWQIHIPVQNPNPNPNPSFGATP
jgi:hypothetical protein